MNVIGPDEREQEREQQRTERDHNRNLEAASAERGMFDGEGRMRRAVVKELTQTDVSDGTAQLVSNMLTKDFVLGNLTEAEQHEIKWLARQMRIELRDIHPHDRSVWQGEFGQFFFEDEYALEALDDLELAQLEQMLLTVSTRAGRGRDGFATRQLNTSINVSERRDNSKESSSEGWL